MDDPTWLDRGKMLFNSATVDGKIIWPNQEISPPADNVLVSAKVSVLQIKHELETISERGQVDDTQLDLLWSKLENIKQSLSRKIRLIEAKEHGILKFSIK